MFVLCSVNDVFNCHGDRCQVWGGDVHVGLYHLLKGDDAKLEGVERIKHAGVITTNVLLEKALPVTGRSSDGITIMDMGSAHGGTARIAAKEFGCNVWRIMTRFGPKARRAKRERALIYP